MPPPPLYNHRDIGKDKDKCDGGEDEDGKEQNTPRGRKTANSQGRRKGRITTRSMANEAASVAAEEAPPPAPEPALPDPPQLPKSDPMQKSMKEPAKPQTPVASMDANKGESSLEVVENVVLHLSCTLTDTESREREFRKNETMQYFITKCVKKRCSHQIIDSIYY